MSKKIKETKLPGQKNSFDTALKNIFSKKENFASAFNELCFKNSKLDVSNLKDLNTAQSLSVTLSDGKKITLQLNRDAAMFNDDENKINLCILGIENQIFHIIKV